MARPRLSFEKKNGKYVDDRIDKFLDLYKTGKSLENACGTARISDVVLKKYLNQRNELYNKKDDYVYSPEDLEIMEFITDFAYARSEGQNKWLKPIEDFRDNPKEAGRKGSADVSISMLKLLYVEYREKQNEEDNMSNNELPELIVDDIKK